MTVQAGISQQQSHKKRHGPLRYLRSSRPHSQQTAPDPQAGSDPDAAEPAAQPVHSVAEALHSSLSSRRDMAVSDSRTDSATAPPTPAGSAVDSLQQLDTASSTKKKRRHRLEQQSQALADHAQTLKRLALQDGADTQVCLWWTAWS